MPLNWNDDNAWILRTELPNHGCAPSYVANGRLGLRLGALILGTDLQAPPLTAAMAGDSLNGTPPFDHTYPLETYAAFARDEFQYCLPSWANIDLRVEAHRFQPQNLTTSSTKPLTTWLDLRTGEAGVDGVWRCGWDMVDIKIRLLIPRSHPHGAFWELELEQLKQPTEITFGLMGQHLAKELEQSYRFENVSILGTASTQRRHRKLGLGLRWQVEGEAEAFPFLGNQAAFVRVVTRGSSLKLRVFYAARGGTESWSEDEIPRDLAALETGLKDGSLRAENDRIWRAIWAQAPDVTTLPLESRDRRFVLAQIYYLLASYDGSAHPTAPLGLSYNGWKGQLLWDTDLWHFRALNAYWPELARQAVKARLSILSGARRYAESVGLKGAWYGLICDEEGNELAPVHYQPEIHRNAWIALAAWESSRRGEDVAWLKEVYPILSAIADATCSRAERDSDGTWHLRGVVPPDESVTENPDNPGTCDDSILTNFAFRTSLQAAITAAKIVGQAAPALWSEVADGLVLQAPRPDGVIPEYAGYSGHNIKQADVILIFWPLSADFPDRIVKANLDYYRERVIWGPLMTEQIDACIRFRHGFGKREEILHDLIARYRRYVRGTFETPYECIDNNNSLMLTACGGLISALTYGWFNVNGLDDLKRVPRLGCL
ncbi:MAG: hypothetical protein LV479_05260 [Methylacidiphilales bacterium]|nr:hypothetical protein [Candidatus Methylacidiphilales bacterium]